MSNPTGYLLVDGDFVYIGHRVTRKIEDGNFTINAANIHNIKPEDVGRSAGGLIYWEPSDTKRRSGGYCVRIGGEGNTLHFPSIDGVTALRDYLNAIINNHREDDK